MDREGAKPENEIPMPRKHRYYFPPELRGLRTEAESVENSQPSLQQQKVTQEQLNSVQGENKEVVATKEVTAVEQKATSRYYRPQFEEPRPETRRIVVRMSPEKPYVPQGGNVRDVISVDDSRQIEGLKRSAPESSISDINKPTTRVKTIPEGDNKSKKTGKVKPLRKVARKSETVSEGKRVPRPSVKAPEDEKDFLIGYNIPNSVYRGLFKELVKEMRHEDDPENSKVTKASITYLKIAAENFLIERYRLASFVRRARGRKTLMSIDMETIDHILDDPYLRRKSCPNIIIQ